MDVHGTRRAEVGLLRIVDGFFGVVVRVERWVHEEFLAVAIAVTIILVVLQFVEWDSLDAVWLSGWLTFIVGLHLALGLPKQAEEAIERLSCRQVLVGSGTSLREKISDSAETWSRAAALIMAVGIFAMLGPFFQESHLLSRVFAAAGAFLVGRAVGRAIGVNMLGRWIERGDWTIRMQPGHVDGAAGLKPIGDLYFRQAMMLAIPTVWLAVVSVLARDELGPDSSKYIAYFRLLLVAVAVEVAAFVVPMMSFHRIMSREKHRLVLEADQQSERLSQLEHGLRGLTERNHRESVAERAAELREFYLRVERLPTWPVDPSVQRRFKVNNALLLIPIVAQVLGFTLSDEGLFKPLSDIFGG